ncbi:hypothetical protein IMZ11_02760 [Microtetraspora sp. AC03309]|uniref:hypothetical protein n=1 Tax=Microtetraspora sp. AC03309 TaxID=2779376 RepID=UPI001E5010A6|nr:hypothetical protein [Microtetraspora sp. AC03309]MCC5574561.1 hypothetical protein [Microtetraspora sp. AC03309]
MSDVFEKGDNGFEFVNEDAVLTPADTDRFLKRLNNELVRAQMDIRRARKQKADCDEAYQRKRLPLLMSEECPDVGRGAGQVTVEERDAWINSQIYGEYTALRNAKDAMEDAVGYGWLVKDQIRVMQSLNNNAKAIYDTYRGGGR